MAKIKMFQIDAFTDEVFHGNPAAVCILNRWLEKGQMQRIAEENNLAETAFIVKDGKNFGIRWFTPTVEVDLCGHATLAAAFVLFNYYYYDSKKIQFISPTSGKLFVEKSKENYTLDFPTDVYKKVKESKILADAFGASPVETYKGKTDFLLIFSTQKEIEKFKPNMDLIESVSGRGVIISAPGKETDFVSRFFSPQTGVNEDPVTGSAHTLLTPVWSKKLDKKVLTAKQLSKRQGDLTCELQGERVKITGQAVCYLEGEIEVG